MPDIKTVQVVCRLCGEEVMREVSVNERTVPLYCSPKHRDRFYAHARQNSKYAWRERLIAEREKLGLPYCPVPDKKVYPTLRLANIAAAQFVRSYDENRPVPMICVCGNVHTARAKDVDPVTHCRIDNIPTTED